MHSASIGYIYLSPYGPFKAYGTKYGRVSPCDLSVFFYTKTGNVPWGSLYDMSLMSCYVYMQL